MQQSLLVTGILLHLPQVISRMSWKKQATQAKQPNTTQQRKVMYKETAFGRKNHKWGRSENNAHQM